MPYVNSSAISRVEYDDRTMQMHITFTSGGTYTFCRVPRSIYDGLLRAGSKGTYYHDHIEGRYQC